MTTSKEIWVSIFSKNDLEGQFLKWKSGMQICIINKMGKNTKKDQEQKFAKNTPERQLVKCDLEWECAK